MLYGGRRVKKSKFQLGDRVNVKGLKLTGPIGWMEYRHEGHVGWHYKVKGDKGEYQTWHEDSLKKVRGRKPLHRQV
jgi:hypothetical protein